MIEDASHTIKVNSSENVNSLKETSVSCLKCVHGSELRCNIQWMKSRRDNISQVEICSLTAFVATWYHEEWTGDVLRKKERSSVYREGGESITCIVEIDFFERSWSLELQVGEMNVAELLLVVRTCCGRLWILVSPAHQSTFFFLSLFLVSKRTSQNEERCHEKRVEKGSFHPSKSGENLREKSDSKTCLGESCFSRATFLSFYLNSFSFSIFSWLIHSPVHVMSVPFILCNMNVIVNPTRRRRWTTQNFFQEKRVSEGREER